MKFSLSFHKIFLFPSFVLLINSIAFLFFVSIAYLSFLITSFYFKICRFFSTIYDKNEQLFTLIFIPLTIWLLVDFSGSSF